MRLWMTAIFLIAMSASPAWSQPRAEPSLQEVADEALRYARLETKTIRSWEKKVRKAPFLPRLQFGFDRTIRNGVDVNVEDTIAVNSSGITIGPTQSKQVQNADSNLNFEVKAVWYLDALIFSQDDLGVSKEARYLNMERERIFSQIRKYYFQRQRGLKGLALLKKQGAPALEKEIKQLEIAETVAALDNLTGGWFSSRIVQKP